MGFRCETMSWRGSASRKVAPPGDSIDKFSRCRWHPGPRELPILEECPRWFVGQILNRQPLGDHAAFLLEPIAANSDGDGRDNLAFDQVKILEPGHDA